MEISVKAKENCVGNGVNAGVPVSINLELGDLLIINCSPSDKWETAETGPSEHNANGDFNNLVDVSGSFFPRAAMIGTLDNGATYFAVGTRLEMKVLNKPQTASPNLKLYCCDSGDGADNSGRITAYIQRIPASAF